MEYYSAVKKDKIVQFYALWMASKSITLSEASQNDKNW